MNMYKPKFVNEEKKVRVRVTDYPNGWGVKTEIDGVEMPDVRDVTFHANVENVPQVTVNMFAHGPIDIDVSAKVTINVVAMEGCELIDVTTHGQDGRTRLVVRRPHEPR